MSRPLRIEYAGAVYHVTSRGNDNKTVFRTDQDRESFLDTLDKVNKRYNWICHAYCLMNSHYHLIIETPDANLSLGMRQLNGVYTQLFNKTYNRTGHLFQGRFKSIVIQKDSHLLEVCRYTVLNPIRKKLVQKPEEWKWSSYRATAGKAKPHPCLATGWVLGRFTGKNGRTAEAYRKFVLQGIGQKSIWTKVRGQALLGEDGFVDKLANHMKKHKNITEFPVSQRFAARPPLDKMFPGDVREDKRKRDRKIAEAVEKHGYHQSEIARHLEVHYSTISRLMGEYEDARRKS